MPIDNSDTMRLVENEVSKFQSDLQNILNNYGNHQMEMRSSIRNFKEEKTKKNLLCLQITDNATENAHKQSIYTSMLEGIYVDLVKLSMNPDLFQIRLTRLRKQLNEQINLLAHLFDFFCVPTRKIDSLDLQLKLLIQELNFKPPENESSPNDDYLKIQIATTVLKLMTAYLKTNNFKQVNDLSYFLTGKSLDDNEGSNIIGKHNIIDKCNSDLICSYNIINAHYLILKKNHRLAVEIILKIQSSCDQRKRLTTNYYESKYYLEYLKFILFTIDRKYILIDFKDLSIFEIYIFKADDIETIKIKLDNETQINILEDSHNAINTLVAQFYNKNTIVASKQLNNMLDSDKNDIIFCSKFFKYLIKDS
jgi:hypothetical protein